MSRSINPMSLFKTGTEPLPSSPRPHRLDESAADYSLTGCSPALPVSASPTVLHRQPGGVYLSSNGNEPGNFPLDFGAAPGQTINYQGGPNQMIEVGQAGRSNSPARRIRLRHRHPLPAVVSINRFPPPRVHLCGQGMVRVVSEQNRPVLRIRRRSQVPRRAVDKRPRLRNSPARHRHPNQPLERIIGIGRPPRYFVWV